jgi:hypothetical protein
MVTGYERLINHCTNEPKDRHVLACAIHSQAEVILTFNLRHFQEEALSEWKISARHPQDYLLTLFFSGAAACDASTGKHGRKAGVFADGSFD